jgi:hypothetical protein
MERGNAAGGSAAAILPATVSWFCRYLGSAQGDISTVRLPETHLRMFRRFQTFPVDFFFDRDCRVSAAIPFSQLSSHSSSHTSSIQCIYQPREQVSGAVPGHCRARGA